MMKHPTRFSEELIFLRIIQRGSDRMIHRSSVSQIKHAINLPILSYRSEITQTSHTHRRRLQSRYIYGTIYLMIPNHPEIYMTINNAAEQDEGIDRLTNLFFF